MKYILAVICVALPAMSFAHGGGTGGIPSIPCYVDGENIGTMEITECQRKKGTTYLHQGAYIIKP